LGSIGVDPTKKKDKNEASSSDDMGFLDHLEELRWRIFKVLISVVLFSALSFFFSDFFLNFLIEPTKTIEPPLTLQVLRVQGMLIVKMWIAFFGGVFLSLPVIVYQMWSFIAPGLYKSEKKHLPTLIVMTFLSFIAGAAFAYYVIIPLIIPTLLAFGVEGIENNISIDYYFSFVLQMIIASGVIFEMPIVAYFLGRIGLLTPAFMRHYRRYAIAVIFIIAALLTPPDPLSQLLLAIPLLVLYEISIYISGFASRNIYDDNKSSDFKP